MVITNNQIYFQVKLEGELLNRVITDRVPNVDQADIIESYRDIVFDISDPNTKTTLDNLWDGFNQNKNYEEMFVQANTLENDIRRTELMVRREMKKVILQTLIMQNINQITYKLKQQL